MLKKCGSVGTAAPQTAPTSSFTSFHAFSNQSRLRITSESTCTCQAVPTASIPFCLDVALVPLESSIISALGYSLSNSNVPSALPPSTTIRRLTGTFSYTESTQSRRHGFKLFLVNRTTSTFIRYPSTLALYRLIYITFGRSEQAKCRQET